MKKLSEHILLFLSIHFRWVFMFFFYIIDGLILIVIALKIFKSIYKFVT